MDPQATPAQMSDPLQLSLVVPVFNEEQVLPATKARLDAVLAQLPLPAEVVFVDDGRHDQTRVLLRRYAELDERYHALFLSRNYGHQIALTAGVDHARGDAVVVMDGDLQDPPELIPRMVEKWREGFQVVYAKRVGRNGESAGKKWTATFFYRLMRLISGVDIPSETGDFRLMDRKVVEALKQMPERFRFLRGMVAWAGFRQCPIYFERPPRPAGVSKYPWRKMIYFALDAIFSFSVVPLRLTFYLGLLMTIVSGGLAVKTLYQRIVEHSVIPGFSALFIMVLFFGGVNLLVSGILGEYIGRIYVEAKRRPLYFLDEVVSQTLRGTRV